MTALILLSIVATTAWMAVDASKRDWSSGRFANATWQWVVGGLFLWILAFPAYLLTRGRMPLKATTPAFAPVAAAEAADAPASRDTSGSVPPPGFGG